MGNKILLTQYFILALFLFTSCDSQLEDRNRNHKNLSVYSYELRKDIINAAILPTDTVVAAIGNRIVKYGLAGLDVVRVDYKELYNQYKDIPGVVFVVDPPYLSTDTSTYNSDKYWRLRDYLDVLNVLVDTNYIFFTSNKSSLIELCEWLDDNKKEFSNPFARSVLNTQNVTLNKTANYTDMMLYRFIK